MGVREGDPLREVAGKLGCRAVGTDSAGARWTSVNEGWSSRLATAAWSPTPKGDIVAFRIPDATIIPAYRRSQQVLFIN